MTSPLRIVDIQRIVAAFFELDPQSMCGREKARRFARPRQIAMYFSRTMTTRSLPVIGARFGGRDHTTVLVAIRAVERLMREDAQTCHDVVAIGIILLTTPERPCPHLAGSGGAALPSQRSAPGAFSAGAAP